MISVFSKVKGYYDREVIYRRDVMNVKEWDLI